MFVLHQDTGITRVRQQWSSIGAYILDMPSGWYGLVRLCELYVDDEDSDFVKFISRKIR